MILTYLAGPLVGSVIGYFTNFIAVKMLFYPRKEVKLFGHVLPFTPGAIPKGKKRLARAIGDVVGETLLTTSDIEEKLLSEETRRKIADMLSEHISKPIRDEMKLLKIDDEGVNEKVSVYLSNAIADTISHMHIADFLCERGPDLIKSKINNPMISMFLTDELLAMVLRPIGEEVEREIANNGPDYMQPFVACKLDEISENSIMEILGQMGFSEDEAVDKLTDMICSVMRNSVSHVMDMVQIHKIVEDKINEMSIDELEKIVMSVMKKELNTIVNLGALIGFLIGTVNIFIP